MAFQYEFKAQTIIDEGRITQNDLEEIKKWMTETQLPKIPDELIVLFLLSCKNVVEDVKTTIKAYFKCKSEAPELFSGRDIDSEKLKKVRNVFNCISIPKRMDGNTVIHFFNFVDSNYHHFDWVPLWTCAYMLIDISQRSNPPNDLVVILDMKGMSVMHLMRLKISILKKFLTFLQEAMPLRIKEIHILNADYIFDKILAIARVFIKSEIMTIMKTHPPGTDMNKFFKEHVPANLMPKDYGGELPTTEELNQTCVEKFRELKEYFQAEEQLIKFKKG